MHVLYKDSFASSQEIMDICVDYGKIDPWASLDDVSAPKDNDVEMTEQPEYFADAEEHVPTFYRSTIRSVFT